MDDNWSELQILRWKNYFIFQYFDVLRFFFFCINVSRDIFCFYLSSSGFIGFQSPKTHVLSPLENYWILTIWISPFYLFSFSGIFFRHICKFNILSSLFLFHTSHIWFTFLYHSDFCPLSHLLISCFFTPVFNFLFNLLILIAIFLVSKNSEFLFGWLLRLPISTKGHNYNNYKHSKLIRKYYEWLFP